MAKRPNLFDRDDFQASLRRQGCPESFVSPITSDFRLFVPLVLREVGERRLFEIVDGARADLGLGPQEPAWKAACKFIVGWAEESVAQYRAAKNQ